MGVQIFLHPFEQIRLDRGMRARRYTFSLGCGIVSVEDRRVRAVEPADLVRDLGPYRWVGIYLAMARSLW